MAKCSQCMKTKGKRKCLLIDGTVCSQCCGTSRTQDKCEGCPYSKTAQDVRRYTIVPYFETHEMAARQELQDVADVIEGAICGFDDARKHSTRDALYLKLMERWMDRYHFGDESLWFADDLESDGFAYLEAAIEKDLPNVPRDLLVKTFGAVYRSIRRRTNGHREYLEFVSNFAGVRVEKGVRMIPRGRFV